MTDPSIEADSGVSAQLSDRATGRPGTWGPGNGASTGLVTVEDRTLSQRQTSTIVLPTNSLAVCRLTARTCAVTDGMALSTYAVASRTLVMVLHPMMGLGPTAKCKGPAPLGVREAVLPH